MRKVILSLVVSIMSLLSYSLFSQVDNEPIALGLPGDNLNLYAVLAVFQKSPSLEGFEKSINDKDTKINNLDLNNDRETDYIQVISYKDGNAHSIVLKVAINKKEFQDVAVITVEKNVAGKIEVQIIGDEALYGKDYIIEPAVVNISETPNPGFTNEKTTIINNTYSIDNLDGNGFLYVNDWPIIVHLFSPVFSIYISPWHWGYYPSYWYPWTPVYYYNYWGFHHHYYQNHFYRKAPYVINTLRYSNYTRRRNSSPTVLQNRTSGRYDATYQGRTYRRQQATIVTPNAPAPRPQREGRVPLAPSRLPDNPPIRRTPTITRPDRPSVRPITPVTRPNRDQNQPSRRGR